MNQDRSIQLIQASLIDPTSDINVRRQGVEQNVERIKLSIEEHGFFPESPILVRPHPNPDSTYDYQCVSGQCRLKACLALGHPKEIPTVVAELTDEEAIQRSWLENEARGDLTFSDKAYWTERIYKQFATSPKYTGRDALELAAKFLGVDVLTVRRYFSLCVLPDDLKESVDQGILSVDGANAIVKNTYDGSAPDQSQVRMRERASWFTGLERGDRKHAIKALEESGHKSSIADLNKYLAKLIANATAEIRIAIPTQLMGELADWGRSRGLQDLASISTHIITEFMRSESSQ